MRKITSLSIAAMLLLFAACTKDDKTDPTKNDPPASPYYFKFNLDGKDYNLNANFPQYMPFYPDEAGGYQVANTGLFPSVGLRLTWADGDTTKESDLLALKGKTLYFDDKAIHPELNFDEVEDLSQSSWYSVDTSNKNFNIKISDVVFLKKDTTLGHELRTYVITGTCNAILERNDTLKAFSNGQFNFVISRQDW